MGRLRTFIRKLLPTKRPTAPLDVEQLRIDFKDRYQRFRLLLAANNKALEVMADIEGMLRGNQAFGMNFVRTSCTAAAVNVFTMVKNLEAIAQGQYGSLRLRCTAIQKEIEGLLIPAKKEADPRLIIPLEVVDKEMTDLVGGKMAMLGEIKNRLGLPVPDGFVITRTAYERFVSANDLQVEIDRRCQSIAPEHTEDLYRLSTGLQQLIIKAEIPLEITSALNAAIDRLQSKYGQHLRAALRSSALGEDAAGSSFAGQYRSILNVGGDSFLQAYKEIVASKYSIQAIAYRLNRGYRDEDIAMCVGCTMMLQAVAGGVAYTRNPIDLREDAIFVSSVWGLPKGVVDGSGACDLYVIDRGPPSRLVTTQVAQKEHRYACLPQEGVSRQPLAAKLRNRGSLTEAQAIEVANLVIAIEKHYGTPQDVEWLLGEDNRVYILQSRPLQTRSVDDDARTSPVTGAPANAIARGGVTASPGAAAGAAYIVERNADVLAFPAGAVLVARQARPQWASLLSRAVAVVTEQGGYAGHLANVAREFGVPALFGLSGLLARLAPGEEITVDADNRVLYAGKLDLLAPIAGAVPNLMVGSPIYETLKRVSRLIIPLNLLDPDADEFHPDNCRTLHDITRFVHEKAVHHMFEFGRTHAFSERSSKQLYHNVPMQWWVLNLDDGFNREVSGKYVSLDNIASIPMLAFWKGFAAVPWDGPPSIDGKGFLAVMFQSTTNPALTPGLRSKYAERNYFMISKNYCSLNSRLGYHFSTIEALIAERRQENYIRFQFKGGAADYPRRLKRVFFIKDILEPCGFHVEIREDNLMARIDGHVMAFMSQRLQVLGYLTLHTRQLDMIMSRPPLVEHYRQRLEADIHRLLQTDAAPAEPPP